MWPLIPGEPPPPAPPPPPTPQEYLEATGTQDAAYRELAQADAAAGEAIAQRTARLRQLQQTLVQVGIGREAGCRGSTGAWLQGACDRGWAASRVLRIRDRMRLCAVAGLTTSRGPWPLQWRGRVVANSNEWQRRNSALAREKEVVLGHHTALKAALAAFRRTQEARLKQMCVS